MRVIFKILLLFTLLIHSCGQHQVYQKTGINDSMKFELGTTIFVAPYGNDLNSGSIESPLKTLKFAIKKAKPTSTIYLREGVFAESARIPSNKSTISIKAYKMELPVITGTDVVKNWKLFRDHIYYAEVNQQVTQLFVGKELMQIARWPNQVTNNPFEYKYAKGDVSYKSHGRKSILKDSNLIDLQGVTLKGVKLWLPFPLKEVWNSFTEDVVAITKDSLEFTSNGYFSKDANNNVINQQARNIKSEKNGYFEEFASEVAYYLSGALGLLDVEKEWFYDAQTKRLYFKAPKGVNPSELDVLARTRLDGIVITGSNILVKGIDFFAASVSVQGNNNTIEACNFYYPRPFFNTKKFGEEPGISLSGKFNSIKKCEVAYSWGTGITMKKSEDGLIEDCLVHDVNWSGSVAAGISVDGIRIAVKNNTIYNCGRSGIRHYYVYNSLFEKNHIYNYGIINHDLGAIKGGLQDYKHTIWRFNFVHDEIANHAKAGIYLDASNDNAVVHHNVLYNVHLSINGEVDNDSVFNNTLVSNVASQKVMKHFQRFPKWDYRSVYLWNNLATNTVKGTNLERNLVIKSIDSIGFVGYEYGDFRLLSTSPAIDRGREIDNITNDVMGDAPDVGAYEHGSNAEQGNWLSGITWSPSWNQLPKAKIQVTQRNEDNMTFDFSGKDATDTDGWIMRYDWDFGDETTSYGKTVQHHYKKRGTYKVVLTLRDNLGGITMIEKQIKIKI
jgi:hypothetical protein